MSELQHQHRDIVDQALLARPCPRALQIGRRAQPFARAVDGKRAQERPWAMTGLDVLALGSTHRSGRRCRMLDAGGHKRRGVAP